MAVRLFNRWAMALAILAASGCQSTPGGQPWEDATQRGVTSSEILLQQALSSHGRQAAELFLEACRSYIEAERFEPARAAFASIQPALLPDNLLGAYQIAEVEIALAQGDIATAQEMLSNATHLRFVPASRTAELQAKICVAANRYRCALSALAGLRTAQAERQHIHDLIWRYLGQAPAFMARSQVELSTGIEQGWWALKASMLQSFSIADQRRRLTTWRSRWPRHPASSQLPTALQELDSELWQPQKIGLLLPLSGPFARAGRAVRDGFVSAYLHAASLDSADRGSADPRSVEQGPLQLVLYDTAREPVAIVYERALLEGVDLLIGPLSKDAVATLNDLNPEVPALALNYLDLGATPSLNLLQLGLAIEDEADTMLARLLEDGVKRVLVFHNYEDWSQRAARRLSTNWPFAVTVQPFIDVKTVTESVGRAMRVEASEQRRDDLSRLLGFELEFLPRARQDLDAVVALVSTVEANALVPALRFHFAQALPVYASSQSVRGAKPTQLDELSGFRVSELPWYLFPDPLYLEMEGAFVLRGNPLSSLYALGVDAFKVSDRLALLARGGANQLLGSTGILSLHNSGRFTRELAWGVISRGQLVALPMVFEQAFE
ncbi:MAG: penicillin-binding protein activator [Gammaproteobacteria bacterium]|nr:penicillin-binding protein activator [Gammaproteobacteria bacterium]